MVFYVHISALMDCCVYTIVLCMCVFCIENFQVHDILFTQRNLFVHPFCIDFMTNDLLLLLAIANVG